MQKHIHWTELEHDVYWKFDGQYVEILGRCKYNVVQVKDKYYKEVFRLRENGCDSYITGYKVDLPFSSWETILVLD